MALTAAEKFNQLLSAIVAGDTQTAIALLDASPELATMASQQGATRREAEEYFRREIGHYIYAGDTALHVAGAAYNIDVVRALIRVGADLRSRNRRGAEPLHYAADGRPNSTTWDPVAQATTIAHLIEAGADPNATDRSGVTPLHRAIRTRSAAAVGALLDAGADPRQPNGKGSTPMNLAVHNTGHSGSGTSASKEQQALIIRLLQNPADRAGRPS